MGWAIDARQRADLATSALGMAIDARRIAGQIPVGINHGDHGDHGTQFTSWTFTDTPARLAWRHRWRTRVELANAIFEYIEGFYNRRRRHCALDWFSPVHFETIARPSDPISSPASS